MKIIRAVTAGILIGLLPGFPVWAVSEEQNDLEIRTIPVNANHEEQMKDWSLQYKMKQQQLYVECILPDFALAKEEKRNHGFLLVKIDGEKAAEMGQAAFVLKHLPPGKHQIDIQPVSYDGGADRETASFEVEVPST
ncbi:hypothetical protein [Salibacterium sp. K-3]